MCSVSALHNRNNSLVYFIWHCTHPIVGQSIKHNRQRRRRREKNLNHMTKKLNKIKSNNNAFAHGKKPEQAASSKYQKHKRITNYQNEDEVKMNC